MREGARGAARVLSMKTTRGYGVPECSWCEEVAITGGRQMTAIPDRHEVCVSMSCVKVSEPRLFLFSAYVEALF